MTSGCTRKKLLVRISLLIREIFKRDDNAAAGRLDRKQISTLFKGHLIIKTRLGQLGANISPDRSSLTPQVLIWNFLFNPFVVCHKYWEKLYELQHINLLSLYLPKEDGVSPDVEYITQQTIYSIFLQ